MTTNGLQGAQCIEYMGSTSGAKSMKLLGEINDRLLDLFFN